MNTPIYSKPTFNSSTWALLAITRFFLAFIVMIASGHLNHFIDIGKIFTLIREFGGKTAVICFLMISGISVGYSFLNSEKGFFKRRILRIYPLYFIAVLGTVIIQIYLGSPYFVKDTYYIAAGYLTSISNFLLLQGIASLSILFNRPLWSISVEVFLYLILPLLSLLRLRYIYLITLVSVILFIINTHIFVIDLYGVQHIIYAWPFIIGFLIVVKKQLFGIIPLVLIGAFGIYYNFQIGFVAEKYAYLWFLFTFMLIVYFLYVNLNLPSYIKTFFNYLGTISYPLYLFHFPIYFILYHIGLRNPYVFVILTISFCVPINYIFDVWLKKVFWKPLINEIDNKIKEFDIKLIFSKTHKV